MKLNIHQRHFLKSKDSKKIRTELEEKFGTENISKLFGKKNQIEWVKLDNRDEMIAINGVLSFWVSEGKYIPLLSLLIQPDLDFKMKYVEVDLGAIPYVTNKADVMRPGIVKIDPTIKKGDIIKIQDEKNKQALAVGEALMDAEVMDSTPKGKVVRNIHTIRDDIWEFSKDFM